MLINQNFAHSEHKSLAKKNLKLINAAHQKSKGIIPYLNFEEVNRLFKDTLIKIDGAYAPPTIRAYKANFERFINFCENISAIALPSDAETVAKYIQNLTKSGLKSASIRLAVASISTIHKLNQLPDPTQLPAAKLELRKMHRTLGRASKQALGITAPIIEKMILAMRNDFRGLRDQALILLAYDSLCRRSELVSIEINDIIFNETGLPIRIRLRKSKTDQEAIGKLINLGAKTQEAIKKWIACSKVEKGFLFRGIKNNGYITPGINLGQVNRIYKRLATMANLSKEQIKNISGHSARVGAAQDLMLSGVSLPRLMHKGR